MKKVYFNKPQRLTRLIAAGTTVLIPAHHWRLKTPIEIFSILDMEDELNFCNFAPKIKKQNIFQIFIRLYNASVFYELGVFGAVEEHCFAAMTF